jgi:hypothetical protein
MSRFAKPAGILLISLAVSGCDITQSSLVSVSGPDAGYPATCTSTLGSYALPKAFLHVQVKPTGATPDGPLIEQWPKKENDKPSDDKRWPVEVLRFPDPAFVFCLDHLNSLLAADTIRVEKSYTISATTFDAKLASKTQFLAAVLVNSTDYTAAIARALIRAAAIAISGNPAAGGMPRTFTPTPALKFGADLTFDPFDYRETGQVNGRLRELGYCIVIEGYTVTAGEGVERYCDAPLRYSYKENSLPQAYVRQEAIPEGATVLPENVSPGIVYRPRKPYTIAVYRRKDPHGPDPWVLQYSQVEPLENLSPVLALQIQRTAFGGRNANFLFDQGTLTAACLSKTSEINGFVDIPVEVLKAVVGIPGQIFTVRIKQLESQKKLVDARNNLLTIQENIAKGNGKYTPVGGLGDPGSFPTIPGVPTAGPGDAIDITPYKAASLVSDPTITSSLFDGDKKLCGATEP